MKTYIYYSKSNNAVEAVVAETRFLADTFLMARLEARSVMIRDDYVLMVTSSHKEGDCTGFNIE